MFIVSGFHLVSFKKHTHTTGQCINCHRNNRIYTWFTIYVADLICCWQFHHNTDSYSFYFSSETSRYYIWMLLGEKWEKSWHVDKIARGRDTNHNALLPIFVPETVLWVMMILPAKCINCSQLTVLFYLYNPHSKSVNDGGFGCIVQSSILSQGGGIDFSRSRHWKMTVPGTKLGSQLNSHHISTMGSRHAPLCCKLIFLEREGGL